MRNRKTKRKGVWFGRTVSSTHEGFTCPVCRRPINLGERVRKANNTSDPRKYVHSACVIGWDRAQRRSEEASERARW